MSTAQFPPYIDLDPAHKVDDDPNMTWDYVLPPTDTGLTGLVIMASDKALYYMHVARSYDLAGHDALSPRYAEEKVGLVPWGIIVLDGYQRDPFEVQGYFYATGELNHYAAVNAFRAVVMDKPALAFYSPQTFGSYIYERIPGIYRYVPGSFKPRWPLGHKACVAEYTFQVEQVSAGSLLLGSDGTVTEVNV